MNEVVRMGEYVKGAEPDRWHWNKICSQYPRVIVQKRIKRPNKDLCDECQDIEKRLLKAVTA